MRRDGLIMICELTELVHRYHDGELAIAECHSMERHILECNECRRLFEELRGLSDFIACSPRAEMPDELVDRLYAVRRSVADGSVLRIAEWLTAAAAMLMIVTLLTWPSERNDRVSQTVHWETVAVMPPADSRIQADSELVVMARWMADDLSLAGKGDLQ